MLTSNISAALFILFNNWLYVCLQISDIETAVSKRDELISRLTESLQASFWQNIPNDEVMVQVQVLVEHVGTLQTQLLQVSLSIIMCMSFYFFLKFMFVLLGVYVYWIYVTSQNK